MTDEHLDPEMDPIPELGDMAPEPGPDYWTAIDARLAAVEAERGSVGTDEISTEGPDDRDTDFAVIRLDDMRNTSNDTATNNNNEWRLRRQSILAIAAAVLLILLGGAALATVLDGDDGDGMTVETADDDTMDDTADDATDDATDDIVDDAVDGDGDSRESQDGSGDAIDTDTGDTDDPTALPTGAACFVGDGVVQVLDIADDGTIRAAVSATDGSLDYTGVGSRNPESGVVVMRFEDATGDTYHNLWQLTPNSLTMGEGDQGSTLTDCADVPRAAELYGTLSTLDPRPDPFVPVLDDATTSCWTKADDSLPIDDFIELVNQDDVEFVRLLSYGLGDDGFVEVIREGTGHFVSDNEVVLDVATWTRGGGINRQTDIYAINEDGSIYPRPYTEFVSVPVDCDVLNAQVRPGLAGFDIGVDTSIELAPGASMGFVEDAVVLGTRNVHRVGANAGQFAIIDIVSVEDNAVFDLIGPNGEWILREETEASLQIPLTGEYSILVGGTRGNASYTLNLEITG